MEETRDRRRKYISSRGVTVYFKALPQLMNEMIGQKMEENGFERPVTPSYEVEVFGGGTEKHELTEKIVKENPEHQPVWDEYMDTLRKWNNEYNERILKVSKLRCMDIEIPDDGWVAEHEFMGFDVPSDPIKRKLYYIDTEVIGSSDDMIAIIQYPIQLSLEGSAVLTAAENMFRRNRVEGKNKAEESGTAPGGEEVDMAE